MAERAARPKQVGAEDVALHIWWNTITTVINFTVDSPFQRSSSQHRLGLSVSWCPVGLYCEIYLMGYVFKNTNLTRFELLVVLNETREFAWPCIVFELWLYFWNRNFCFVLHVYLWSLFAIYRGYCWKSCFKQRGCCRGNRYLQSFALIPL